MDRGKEEEKPHAMRSKGFGERNHWTLKPGVNLSVFLVHAAVVSTSLGSRSLQLSGIVLPKEEKPSGTQQESREPGV